MNFDQCCTYVHKIKKKLQSSFTPKSVLKEPGAWANRPSAAIQPAVTHKVSNVVSDVVVHRETVHVPLISSVYSQAHRGDRAKVGGTMHLCQRHTVEWNTRTQMTLVSVTELNYFLIHAFV